MGLGGSLKDFVKHTLDPGGLVDAVSGKEGREAADKAAELQNAELLRQFEQTQANLRPSLEAATRTLPGL